jgi:aryl-alcohol dehydrogenase-like predicted oxidoreductase
MSASVPMQRRPLGSSGLKVSAVGLGGNNFGGRLDLAATRAVVHKALDLGITLFDTADVYGNKGGSENYLGEVLGARRKEIVLATKFGLPMDAAGLLKGASRRYIMQAVEASLKRLRTDWIDLYQLHRPDPLTPIEETLRALDELVRQGKVRHVGCSNLSAAQVVAAREVAARHGLAAFISCQDEYSLLARGIEQDLIPTMEAKGLGLLPYFPLAGGFLTGKYKRGAPAPKGARLAYSKDHAHEFINDRNWRIVEKLDEFCSRHGRTMLELAFGWLIAKPVVASVIAGASTPKQVEQNVRAIGWALSPGDLSEVNRSSE